MPDVFIAEPVGSCTDLKATVDYPLRRLYGEQYALAPFSVLVDPQRAMQILGWRTGKSFSPKVLYIYDKQLEEADIIASTRSIPSRSRRCDKLRAALQAKYPAGQSARDLRPRRRPAWKPGSTKSFPGRRRPPAPWTSITTPTPKAKRCWAG